MVTAERSGTSATSAHAELDRTYLTPNEVSMHSSPHADCWVSFLGRVYNVTTLIQNNRGGCDPTLRASALGFRCVRRVGP